MKMAFALSIGVSLLYDKNVVDILVHTRKLSCVVFDLLVWIVFMTSLLSILTMSQSGEYLCG